MSDITSVGCGLKPMQCAKSLKKYRYTQIQDNFKTVKIRVYSPYFPFPATEGMFQIVCDQIATLCRKGHQVQLVIWKDGSNTIQSKIKKWKKEKNSMAVATDIAKLLILTFKNIEAGFQTLDKWEEIEKLNTPIPKSQNVERLSRTLKSIFSPWASPELFYYSPRWDFRNQLKPVDMAIYHYSFAYPWLLKRDVTQEKKVIVHLHNLESDLFKERAKDQNFKILKLIHRLNSKKLERHEKKLPQLVDEVWFVSPTDLQEYKGSEENQKFRFVAPTFRHLRSDHSKPHSTPTLGFIGGLHFDPNIKSVRWIITKLAPQLVKCGFRGELIIVGKKSPRSLIQLARPYRFIKFLGFVQNLDNFWDQIDYMLVPHITGSGVRIKLLEAIARGVPVIANEAATKRIHPTARTSSLLFTSDNEKEWADKICKNSPAVIPNKLNPGIDGHYIYDFI